MGAYISKLTLGANLLALTASCSFADETLSLCRNGETAAFTCTVKGGEKTLSLCRSESFDRNHGYIQYRFGLDSRAELEFPTNLSRTQEKFRYGHYHRHQVDRLEISFNIGNTTYTIFDYYDGDENPPTSEQGVLVTVKGKKKIVIQCDSHAKGNLGELKASIQCDAENPLNLEGCKK